VARRVPVVEGAMVDRHVLLKVSSGPILKLGSVRELELVLVREVEFEIASPSVT
jgi:hypothetical protein